MLHLACGDPQERNILAGMTYLAGRRTHSRSADEVHGVRDTADLHT